MSAKTISNPAKALSILPMPALMSGNTASRSRNTCQFISINVCAVFCRSSKLTTFFITSDAKPLNVTSVSPTWMATSENTFSAFSPASFDLSPNSSATVVTSSILSFVVSSSACVPFKSASVAAVASPIASCISLDALGMSSESFSSISFADAVIGTTANLSNASPISINDLPIAITPSPIKSGNEFPNSAIFFPTSVKISPTIPGISAMISLIRLPNSSNFSFKSSGACCAFSSTVSSSAVLSMTSPSALTTASFASTNS